MAGNKQSYSSYQNPQIAVNRSFEVMAQQRKLTSTSLQQTAKSIGEGIKAQKESQKKMQDDLNKFQQTQADRVADITEIGKSGFDANTNNYFQSQIDNYIKIKNGIESGDVNRITGSAALAEINQRVAKYQQAAPIVIAEAQRILEAMNKPEGTPGAMYSQVPTDQQQMLIDLAGQSESNGSNIHIVDLPTGGLALYNPDNEAMINLDELVNMEASGKEYFREVPDIKEDLAAAANAIIGEKGSRVDGTVDIQTRNEGGRTITTESMTEEQYDAAINNMINGGGLGALIESDDMDIIWNDVLGYDEPWNPNNKNDVYTAKYKLAEKALKDSGVGIPGREIQKGNTKTSLSSSTEERDYTADVMKEALDEAKSFMALGPSSTTPNLKGFAKSLNRRSGVAGQFVVETTFDANGRRKEVVRKKVGDDDYIELDIDWNDAESIQRHLLSVTNVSARAKQIKFN